MCFVPALDSNFVGPVRPRTGATARFMANLRAKEYALNVIRAEEIVEDMTNVSNRREYNQRGSDHRPE